MTKTWQENAGLLALRAGVGGVLVAHGVQKLFGWLGNSSGGSAATGSRVPAPHSSKWGSSRASQARSRRDWVRPAAVSSSRSVSPPPQQARRRQEP